MTQKERILNLLQTTRRVPAWRITTPRPMGGLGVMQYGARILELRREGYDIRNNKDENGNTYFELIEEGKLL